MDKEELLAVLDMSENDQLFFLNNLWQNRLLPDWFNLHPDIHGKLTMHDYNRMICADLAFRLRDESKSEVGYAQRYYTGLEEIYKYRKIQKQCQSFYAWTVYRLAPIDMIIAALIAKGEITDG